MKKILNGRSAAVIFVASCVLFAGLIVSCSNAQPKTPSTNITDASASLTCAKCLVTPLSQDTSPGHPGGPKLVFRGVTTADIPAGTEINIEVLLDHASN